MILNRTCKLCSTDYHDPGGDPGHWEGEKFILDAKRCCPTCGSHAWYAGPDIAWGRSNLGGDLPSTPHGCTVVPMSTPTPVIPTPVPEPEVVKTVDYAGRTLVLLFHPEYTSFHQVWKSEEIYERVNHSYFTVTINNRRWTYNETSGDKAIANVKAQIDRYDEDDRIYDRLVEVVGQVSQEVADAAPDASPSTPVGAVVAFYSRGSHRRGIAVKVGKKNVEVAYVTVGGLTDAAKRRGGKAGVTRKAIPFARVGVLS